MNITTVIVAIVVLLAVVYLGRDIRGLFKGTTSCCSSCGGGCSCSTTKESKKNVDESKLPPCCRSKS